MFACNHSRMGQRELDQTPEGRLIEEVTKASGRSIRSLAANAGMSDARWRQIMKGFQSGPGGEPVRVVAPAKTLARMATVLRLKPEEVAGSGRTDAAELMPVADLVVKTHGGKTMFVEVKGNRDLRQLDEIALIRQSTTMSAREKLELIRMVLELRAQAELEDEQAQNEASASRDAEAPIDQQG